MANGHERDIGRRIIPIRIPQWIRREREGPEHELQKLSDEAIEVLRDAYAMEGPNRQTLDFDLAFVKDPKRHDRAQRWHKSAPTKREWTEIVGDIDGLLVQAKEISLTRNGRTALQREFLLAELIAHSTFYRGKAGQEFPFAEFVRLTQCIKPQIIEESAIRAQSELVIKGFGGNDKESIERYRREHLVSEEGLPDEIRSHAGIYLEAVSDFLGKRIEPSYKIKPVQEDSYWMNWISGNRDGFTLKVNTHPRHAGRWTDGKVEAMAAHEIAGHAAQMESWKSAIDRHELLSVLGLTSVHYPGQVSCEGIAQTIHLFVPNLHRHFSEYGELELELEGLRQMIYNNIHIMANTTGAADEDMIDYMHRFYPAEPEDEIKRQIEERREDPVKRTYLYAYGIGFRLHQWYAMNLNTEGKRELLKFVFSQPTTPEQEYNLFIQLVSDLSGRYGSITVPFSDSQTLLTFFFNLFF